MHFFTNFCKRRNKLLFVIWMVFFYILQEIVWNINWGWALFHQVIVPSDPWMIEFWLCSLNPNFSNLLKRARTSLPNPKLWTQFDLTLILIYNVPPRLLKMDHHKAKEVYNITILKMKYYFSMAADFIFSYHLGGQHSV